MGTCTRITALTLVVLLTGGCYGAKMLRQPIAVDNTEQRVQVLAEQQAKLNTEIRELRTAIARQEEMLRALRADTQTRLGELTANVEAVGSRVDDSFERPAAYYPVVPTDQPAQQTPDWSAPPDTAPPAPELTQAQIKAIYDNAYLDLNRRNYQLALIGFRDYLNRSPDSDLSDNAQYWIGECYYAQKDFRRAIDEFRLVEGNFPRGDKVPAAMLKIGLTHLQLGEREDARSVLRDLVNRFPTSEEAVQARARIQSLD